MGGRGGTKWIVASLLLLPSWVAAQPGPAREATGGERSSDEPASTATESAAETPSEPASAPGDAEDETEAPDEPAIVRVSHPLVIRSPSPDTKARFDYDYANGRDADGKVHAHALRLTGEVALHPTFSVQAALPFVFQRGADPDHRNLGNLELTLKAASFTFAEHGVLLGYGLDLALPTGDDQKGIGSDHLVELEPFFDMAWKWGALEVVAFLRFGVPFNQDPGEETRPWLGYDLSVLYPMFPRVFALLELFGDTILSGPGAGETALALGSGIKVQPLDEHGLVFGLSVVTPLTDQALDLRVLGSVFYHFGWLGPSHGVHDPPI